MDIRHKKSSSGRAYDAPICELWIDLPGGARLSFADIEFSEWDTDAENDLQIAEAKARIISGLRALMSASQ